MAPDRKCPSAQISNWPHRALLCAALFANVLFANALLAETIDLYFDNSIPQISFAADEVRAALTKQGHSPANKALTALPSGAFANKSVVIGLKANLTTALTNDGGSSAGLPSGEQAYGLRTTTKSQQVYWVIGADKNGAMYGGITLSEKIGDTGLSGTHNEQESPHILNRGVKYNLPLDRKCPTYFAGGEQTDQQMWEGTSAQKAIPHVWDMGYWEEWFDEMARARFNVLSLWNCHYFPAMLDIPEAFDDVEYYGGDKKTITKANKVKFWQDVMAYGKSRGFKIYFFSWNIYTFGAVDPSNKLSNSRTDADTRDYHYRAVKKMLETYPDLDGLGTSAGENLDGTDAEAEKWLWDAFGKAIYDHMSLPANSARKFTFIHRTIQTSMDDVIAQFQPLVDLPNVTMDFSFKYSSAHMYSTTTPGFIDSMLNDLDDIGNTLKTWLEVRNDNYYFLHFGDPQFAREYIGNWPKKGSETKPDTYIAGFMYGSDGWVPTRDFSSKSAVFSSILEIKRNWLSQKIWGKLSYNPSTPDSFFINEMKRRWPGIDADKLFAAWTNASRALPLSTEMVGNWKFDYWWWPELCERDNGFKSVGDFEGSSPIDGSNMISIPKTAGGQTSPNDSFKVATKIEDLAKAAASSFNTLSNPSSYPDLVLVYQNIKAQIYLNLFYAGKIRGATYGVQNNAAQTKTALNLMRSGWHGYTDIMDVLYKGSGMVRVQSFANWHVFDDEVDKEYTDAGGKLSDANPLASLFTVSTTNTAPTVNAGADITITLPASASLVGSVSDDGLPTGSTLPTTWSKVSGPGTVTFANAGNKSTTATFSVVGTYVLRLTASDGALSSIDDMSVNVSAAGVTAPPKPASPTTTGNGTATPTVSGVTTAGATVHIWVDGTEVGTTTAAADGTWTYTLTGLTAGTHSVTVTAENSAGTSSPSTATTVTVAASGGGAPPASDGGGGGGKCGLGGISTAILLFAWSLFFSGALTGATNRSAEAKERTKIPAIPLHWQTNDFL